MTSTTNRNALIKTIYFYLVSLIGLMMVVLPTADLVNIVLKTTIFPKANMEEYRELPCPDRIIKAPDGETDEQYQSRVERCERSRVNETERLAIRLQKDIVRDLSFLVVGIPLFLYHWITIRKDRKERDK
ncbi:hypothetical protein GF380_05915 [Candidatus Uhrbacteria bacterium]|nr:hypothetical protein [Candidatus Uhrbacteria bacterium]